MLYKYYITPIFPGTSYTLLELPEEPADVASTFACTLKFLVKDCDPSTGEADPEGYEVFTVTPPTAFQDSQPKVAYFM